MAEQNVEKDEDGFDLDEWGNAYGYCNACGEEAPADTECCDGGEVVPYDSPSNLPSESTAPE